MRLLPVTALASWVHCPRQFFMSYVLKVEEPMNAAMVLGSVKHKFHELASLADERIILQLKKSDGLQEVFAREFTGILRESVVKSVNSLRQVQVTLLEAFESGKPVLADEVRDRVERLSPLIAQGLSGDALWSALSPKIKSEYRVQSEKLGLKGRIDKLECYGARLVPVELKSGKAPVEGVWDGHRIQAGSYALLLEDVFQTTVPEAVVHYVDHKARRSVMLNPFLREEIIEIAAKARQTIESTELPKGCAREGCKYCAQCEQANFVTEKLHLISRKS